MSTLGPTDRESLTFHPQLLSAPRRSSSVTWAEDVESVFWPWLVYISTVSITGSAYIFSSSSTQFYPYHQQQSDPSILIFINQYPYLHYQTHISISTTHTVFTPSIDTSPRLSSSLEPNLLCQHYSLKMDISFDPFNFGATTLALIIAAIELYYTRPRRVHQVSLLLSYHTVLSMRLMLSPTMF
jgi:hypothetical protein